MSAVRPGKIHRHTGLVKSGPIHLSGVRNGKTKKRRFCFRKHEELNFVVQCIQIWALHSDGLCPKVTVDVAEARLLTLRSRGWRPDHINTTQPSGRSGIEAVSTGSQRTNGRTSHSLDGLSPVSQREAAEGMKAMFPKWTPK